MFCAQCQVVVLAFDDDIFWHAGFGTSKKATEDAIAYAKAISTGSSPALGLTKWSRPIPDDKGRASQVHVLHQQIQRDEMNNLLSFGTYTASFEVQCDLGRVQP